jgi:hypothetical protein
MGADMLVRITGPAEVRYFDGRPVVDPLIIRELNGAESDEHCSNYLETDLADLGISGGSVRLTYNSAASRFNVSSDYVSPGKLEPRQLDRLTQDTDSQWSDGIGEHCFSKLAKRLNVVIDLTPFAREMEIHVEQIDDGLKPAKPKSLIATAAREGNLGVMRELQEQGADLEVRLQGYTPLHLAIIYGQMEAAIALINWGADLFALDPEGQDSLMLTTLTNGLADHDAAQVAKELLKRGVVQSAHKTMERISSVSDYTPIQMARERGKTLLVGVFEEFARVT